MSKFTLHTIDTAPEGSKPVLEATMKDKGRIPNLASTMAGAPGLLATYKFAHQQFLQSSLTNEEKTVVWLSVSVEHGSHYSVPAHTKMAKAMNVDDALAQALRDEAPLPNEKLEALRNFTLLLVRNNGAVADADVKAFLDAGFTEANILEIIVGIAQKVMSNYTNILGETPVDAPLQEFAWEKKPA